MQKKDVEKSDRQPVILFADDDEFCLSVVVKMLNRLGCSVLEARDGHEAIEVYKKNQDRIDLVILDMKMPHNGASTYEQLRKINTEVKIFVTSGYTEDHRITELLKQGCDGFIQKPFNLNILSQVVTKALSIQI
jgi:CheY-like chemotaxis protein